MPVRLTRPGVGRMLTTEFHAAGRRIDATVSSPMATGEKFVASGAPEPADAARAADRAFEIVGVARDAEDRAIGVAGGEFGQRRLAEDDRAGLAQLVDRE